MSALSQTRNNKEEHKRVIPSILIKEQWRAELGSLLLKRENCTASGIEDDGKFPCCFSKCLLARYPLKWDCQCNFQPFADEYALPGPLSRVRKLGFGVSVGLSGDVETSPPPPRGFVYSAFSNPGRKRSSDIIFPRSNQAKRPGNIASNPPVPSLQNLSCLIPLMMDFKSERRTRKSSEVMQLHVRADSPSARSAKAARKVFGFGHSLDYWRKLVLSTASVDISA
ncbi:uncharacterized protein LOC113139596 [Mastacembelus armatus]|uniref:uncharacterized protein LOC113139596 n=1 Tax=Mastacembelus armatus TaxID=205130 RepID=UPI000E45C92A|nr:uncharacterized protein LOC113139596 [Mastacembelus armatus]